MTEVEPTDEEIKKMPEEKILELYREYKNLEQKHKNLNTQTETLKLQTQTLQAEISRMKAEDIRRRWKVESPPTFHGNKTGPKVSMWLFHLRQYFEATGITDEKMIVNYAATLLRDNAMVVTKGVCV